MGRRPRLHVADQIRRDGLEVANLAGVLGPQNDARRGARAEVDELQARLSYELALAEIARIAGWTGAGATDDR